MPNERVALISTSTGTVIWDRQGHVVVRAHVQGGSAHVRQRKRTCNTTVGLYLGSLMLCFPGRLAVADPMSWCLDIVMGHAVDPIIVTKLWQ